MDNTTLQEAINLLSEHIESHEKQITDRTWKDRAKKFVEQYKLHPPASQPNELGEVYRWVKCFKAGKLNIPDNIVNYHWRNSINEAPLSVERINFLIRKNYESEFQNIEYLEKLPLQEQPTPPADQRSAEEIHRNALNVLEKHLGNKFYETGGLHNAISDAMVEYASQSKPVTGLSDDQEINEMTKLKDYWYNRCFQAEQFIEASPSDPDITEEQRKAYKLWNESK